MYIRWAAFEMRFALEFRGRLFTPRLQRHASFSRNKSGRFYSNGPSAKVAEAVNALNSDAIKKSAKKTRKKKLPLKILTHFE
jgi:hypothetical protein